MRFIQCVVLFVVPYLWAGEPMLERVGVWLDPSRTNSQVCDVAVAGNYACVADGDAGLAVVDVSDARYPILAGSHTTASAAQLIAVNWPYAYVVEADATFEIFDLTDAHDPILAGSGSALGNVNGAAVDNKYLYLVGYHFLEVLDVSNPSVPVEVGGCGNWFAYYSDLALYGTNVCVADSLSGLQLIDVSDPTQPTVIGIQPTAPARDVVVGEGIAYLAAWGIDIVDLSASTGPESIGNFMPNVGPARLALGNGFLFVTDTGSQIEALDLSCKTNPFPVAIYTTAGQCSRIAVGDGVAFAADGSAGLEIFKLPAHSPPGIVKDPAGQSTFTHDMVTMSITAAGTPALCYQWQHDGNDLGNSDRVHGANGSTLVISNAQVSDSGVYSVIVSNQFGVVVSSNATLGVKWAPNPQLVGAWPDFALGFINSVVAHTNLVLAGTDHGGLFIIDTTDPANPKRIGGLRQGTNVIALAINGAYAYVVDSTGLEVIDISDPQMPSVVGAPLITNAVGGMVLAGDRAFIAAESAGLQIVDVSIPTNFVVIGGWTNGVVHGVARSSDRHVCVVDQGSRFDLIDTSDPANPRSVGNCPIIGRATGLAVNNGYAYVATDGAGFEVIDIRDPAAPTVVSTNNKSAYLTGVSIHDNRLYVTGWPKAIQIYDLTDPGNPVMIEGQDGFANGVGFNGHYAYVGDYSGGLVVLDLNAPEGLRSLGHFQTGGDFRKVILRDHYAYIVDYLAGLHVVDVSNPSAPREAGFWPGAGLVDFAVNGVYACAPAEFGGMYVFDISKPEAPSLVGFYATNTDLAGVAVSGGYAYLAAYDKGLLIIDVHNPKSPVSVGSWTTTTDPVTWASISTVAVRGNLVHAAGLVTYLLDVSDPVAPIQQSFSYASFSGLWQIALHGNYMLGVSSQNLTVFDSDTLAFLGSAYRGAHSVAASGGYAYLVGAGTGGAVLDIRNPAAMVIARTFDADPQARAVVISNNFAYVVGGTSGLRILSLDRPTNSPPQIVSQPVSKTFPHGNPATFSPLVDGTEPFTYQWFRDGTSVTGAHDSYYTIPHALLGDSGGAFFCTISNAFGAITSQVATLTVGPASIVVASLWPSDVTTYAGVDVSFTAYGSGAEPIHYQWLRDGVELHDNAKFVGTIGDTLTIRSVQAVDQGIYSARIWNMWGSTNTRSAHLTVMTPKLSVLKGSAQSGQIQVSMTGVTARGYEIDVSEDLTNWSFAAFVSGNGTNSFTISPGVARRFYRAIISP